MARFHGPYISSKGEGKDDPQNLCRWHSTILPGKEITTGVDCAIMAFANSSLFVESPPGEYTPFAPISEIRGRFANGTKLLIAIGGWGDTAGFSAGSKEDAGRKQYAKNVADMVNKHGFDGVDIDWEYPGGNGLDYKETSNSAKKSEIDNFPLFLKEIRNAIGTEKQLSIAVPGRKSDMIAYTPENGPAIWESVDFVNVLFSNKPSTLTSFERMLTVLFKIMTYDLINRRDNVTAHHTSVKGCLGTVQNYLDVKLPPEKINLGFAFYAKYFTLDPKANCTSEKPVGCPIVHGEFENGTDAGTSGSVTFEVAQISPPRAPVGVSPNATCGPLNEFRCEDGFCCSSAGYCGETPQHCNSGCQPNYGKCDGVDTGGSFRRARTNGMTDREQGGRYYVDEQAKLFWTWETTDLIARKFEQIVCAKKLGGVMAWGLGLDSYDWSHLEAVEKGMEGYKGTAGNKTSYR
ncbi:extracellular chitinase [Histoplasma capsulatum var. duboisii H88]|uniref:chitinase n=1 Tax=Ajellomyces capsulatus (strain H88) TaxID=544711 RepID=F0UU80_AJEC8|nr:extracellular chitinase [Histoplasma capsulatum var. duboisii H88]